jgi:hypothetical protein
MRQKDEDRLLKDVFGELSEKDAQELEHWLRTDAKASRTRQEFAAIRDGLKGLRDIPEPQISAERVRDAILNQGLRPSRRPLMSRLWVPSASVMLAALGFVYLSGLGSAPEQMPPDAAALAMAQPVREEAKSATPIARPTPPPRAVAAQPTTPRPAAPRRRARAPELYAMASQPVEEPVDPAPPAVNSVSEGTPAVERAEMPAAETAAQPEEPIVLIAPEVDQNTGAPIATEVQNASNILVGG